jgi:hypothetical protein
VKIFTKLIDTGNNSFDIALTTDSNGNVYVTGQTTSGIDGNVQIGTSDYFVTKFNSAGVKQYTIEAGLTGKYAQTNSVCTDLNGNIYVTGLTNGGLDGNTLTGINDMFVTKYNSSGVKQFTKQLGVSGQSTGARAVAVDINGNVFISGSTTGGLDGNTLTGTTDFFVVKFNSSGVKQ